MGKYVVTSMPVWNLCLFSKNENPESHFVVSRLISDELTRLWNLNHDNMEACKSDSRSVKWVRWRVTSV